MSIRINSNPHIPGYQPAAQKSAPGSGNSALPDNPFHIQLDMNALYTAGSWVPGGGMMSASVFKSENYTADNPVMLVKGTNVDGVPFEAEVNINHVNPKDASFIEMLALDGYFAADGQPSGAARAAAAAMAPDGIASNNGFTKFDFLTPLTQLLETQRLHNNWDGYFRLKPVVDNLLNHIAKM